MQGLIGKKIGMTRVFDDSGRAIAVTVIQTGKNIVHQIKTPQKDGYSAVQIGYGATVETKLSQPRAGHFKKLGSSPTRRMKEFSLDTENEELKSGQEVGVEVFENVKYVDVTGISKGRGHAGTIKRYNFQRGRETHGNTNVRDRGSIGACSYPARVFPGLKMSGHYGSAQVTTKGLEVIAIDKEENVILVKGAVPGCNKGIVYIHKNITL